MVELRRLSEYCNYGNSTTRCCEIAWCLAEVNLTFKMIYEIAQAMEAVKRSVKELQGTGADSVHRMFTKKGE